MSTIQKVDAREVFDSRGFKTVEAMITTQDGESVAVAPKGASTGELEAVEKRDKDGGVRTACENVRKVIGPRLIGMDPAKQQEIDELMIELDGTGNKSNLGGNATTAVSIAAARAGAKARHVALYQHIAFLYGTKRIRSPCEGFNILNGGVHSGNENPFQELMIMPVGAKTPKEGLEMAAKVYHALKDIIKKDKRFGPIQTGVGDEAGFAPNISTAEAGCELITRAIKAAELDTAGIVIGMDSAASEFYVDDPSGPRYDLGFKIPGSGDKLHYTREQLLSHYKTLKDTYGIAYFEDPFGEKDPEAFKRFTAEVGRDSAVIADDLTVTNAKRIRELVRDHGKDIANGLLVKINQPGTVWEALEASHVADDLGWMRMVSHRSGEGFDNYLPHFAVGTGAGAMKPGAPARERNIFHNELLRIAEAEENWGTYAGRDFRDPLPA